MLLMKCSDKPTALAAAFSSRFAICFIAANVTLPMHPAITGALMGLLVRRKPWSSTLALRLHDLRLAPHLGQPGWFDVISSQRIDHASGISQVSPSGDRITGHEQSIRLGNQHRVRKVYCADSPVRRVQVLVCQGGGNVRHYVRNF